MFANIFLGGVGEARRREKGNAEECGRRNRWKKHLPNTENPQGNAEKLDAHSSAFSFAASLELLRRIMEEHLCAST